MRPALLAVAVLTVAAATSACGRDSASARLSARDAERVLIDRNWMDRWPQHKDDRLRLYRFTPSMGGGVYQDRKLFKGQFELFRFTAADATIDFDFPDADEQVRSSFLIERVRGPEPFDLRLTIADDPRGPGVYFAVSGARGQDLDPAAPPSQ